jgi:hypothetical protein
VQSAERSLGCNNEFDRHGQSRRVIVVACCEERDTSREGDRFEFREDRGHKPGVGSRAASNSRPLICERLGSPQAEMHSRRAFFRTIPSADKPGSNFVNAKDYGTTRGMSFLRRFLDRERNGRLHLLIRNRPLMRLVDGCPLARTARCAR